MIILTGPTGTGKSDWALALAETLPVEIVSCDSAQVFRGLDIGTAKPDAATRARVPHHLLDLRDPAESYSAGEFVTDATAALRSDPATASLGVVALSASAEADDMQRAREAGAIEYWTKPLDMHGFHADVARALGRRVVA